ncbi:MAG: hypothetical protein LCH95_06025 [Proteobacteria bacterium]|nr:hypothetical protein [Pseudomonadota bacterium]
MQRIDIERRNRLIANFTVALDLLEDAGREPDRWEEECLSYALGALACGMILVAEVELDAFFRPLDDRSPEVLAALAKRPARFSRAMLRHGLDYVRTRQDEGRAPGDLPAVLRAGQQALQASLA